MSEDDRIARLEHRLQVLEALVRQLASERAAGGRPVAETPPPGPASPVPEVPRVPVAPPPVLPPRPAPVVASPSPPRPATRGPGPGTEPAGGFFTEQWLGQRGLLAVGVVFVILAAGYLLKLSFDRGWVSPLVRCISGTIAGGALSALGWWLHRRGYRTYGAALIGCGAAVIYLAVWAAARLYQFLPPTPGIAALALVSIGLAAIALAIDVEALLASAALGAFFAPIVIGKEGGSVDFLLLYLGAMGAALGWVAAQRRWRLATFVIALAYFGVASFGILSEANAAGLYLYAILGGAAGLFVGLREGWLETRFLAFAGGWGVLAVANEASASHWPTLLGGIVLTAPVWWRALRAGTVWPDGTMFGDSFYFYVSPFLLGAALYQVAPETFDRHEGLVPTLIALPYLAAGLSAARRPFALVAALALVTAAVGEWSGLAAMWALLGLTLCWSGIDHPLRREDGRWYALVSLGAALVHLLLTDLPAQPETEAAFTGPWALALWGSIAVTSALAAGLLRQGEQESQPRLRPLLWGLAGLLLFLGVTGELLQYFEHAGLDPQTAHLAGGLSVSAWWICFAAACFVIGFRRRVSQLRWAGFAVAGLALAKVVLVDLSELDALYRVGSAFILGVVSLSVAYAYHRRGQGAGGTA